MTNDCFYLQRNIDNLVESAWPFDGRVKRGLEICRPDHYYFVVLLLLACPAHFQETDCTGDITSKGTALFEVDVTGWCMSLTFVLFPSFCVTPYSTSQTHLPLSQNIREHARPAGPGTHQNFVHVCLGKRQDQVQRKHAQTSCRRI